MKFQGNLFNEVKDLTEVKHYSFLSVLFFFLMSQMLSLWLNINFFLLSNIFSVHGESYILYDYADRKYFNLFLYFLQLNIIFMNSQLLFDNLLFMPAETLLYHCLLRSL